MDLPAQDQPRPTALRISVATCDTYYHTLHAHTQDSGGEMNK